VAVALFIGTIELTGLLVEKLRLHGSLAQWLEGFNINWAGFLIAAMFVGTWAAALAIWRFARIEEKWSVGVGLAASSAQEAKTEQG
jgi:nickel/cobalt transporter (NiCoT) family protein